MSNRFIFEQAPGHLIRRAHQISVAVFADEVGAHAVTPVQFAILNLLLGQPGIDQITLAQGVAFDAATIGSVIGRLEKKAGCAASPMWPTGAASCCGSRPRASGRPAR